MRGDRTWMIVVAAAMWGFSGLLRKPLAAEYDAMTIVLLEHVILVLLVSPFVVPAVRAALRVDARTKLALLVIGAGSSALATTMFTMAFRLSDPITPQVLQKTQPLVALLLAAMLLGERVTSRFAVFAVPAVVGVWLVAFPDPFGVEVRSLQGAGLALGAAALWAAGTVLGRHCARQLSFVHVLTLRFLVGGVTMLVLCLSTGRPVTVDASALPNLLLLAAGPGLVALLLYYKGLQSTTASLSSIAELTFPLTSAAVGVWLLGATLAASQWVGFVVLLVSIVLLTTTSKRRAGTPLVRAPEPERVDAV